MNKHKWASRLAIILLALGLLVSLVFNFILYRQGRGYYLQLNATRLDPLGLEAHPARYSESERSLGAAHRIIFLGDSRITQWPQPAIDGYQIVNRGIGAQTSTQVLGRYDVHVKPLEPDILLVQVGINDLKAIPLITVRRLVNSIN